MFDMNTSTTCSRAEQTQQQDYKYNL